MINHMTAQEIINRIEAASDDYSVIGIRFEDLPREIGEICGNSKHNPYRYDERDYPEYGTEEYNELPELDGTCSWLVGNWRGLVPGRSVEKVIEAAASRNSLRDHCYLIASDSNGDMTDYTPDEGEVIIKDAVVIDIIY